MQAMLASDDISRVQQLESSSQYTSDVFYQARSCVANRSGLHAQRKVHALMLMT